MSLVTLMRANFANSLMASFSSGVTRRRISSVLLRGRPRGFFALIRGYLGGCCLLGGFEGRPAGFPRQPQMGPYVATLRVLAKGPCGARAPWGKEYRNFLHSSRPWGALAEQCSRANIGCRGRPCCPNWWLRRPCGFLRSPTDRRSMRFAHPLRLRRWTPCRQ